MSNERLCRYCKFIKQYLNVYKSDTYCKEVQKIYDKIVDDISNNNIIETDMQLYDNVITTVCRRNPPTLEGYPKTVLYESCGEFKYRLNEPEQCEICKYFQCQIIYEDNSEILYDGVCRKDPNYIKKKAGDWCGSFDAIDPIDY